MEGVIIFIVILTIVAAVLAYTVGIVPQAEAYVVERLGAYYATWTLVYTLLCLLLTALLTKLL